MQYHNAAQMRNLPFDRTLWSAALAGAGRAFAAAYRVGVIPAGIVLHPSKRIFHQPVWMKAAAIERDDWDIELLGCSPPPMSYLMAEIILAGSVARGAAGEHWLLPDTAARQERDSVRETIDDGDDSIPPPCLELTDEYADLLDAHEQTVCAIAITLASRLTISGEDLRRYLAGVAARPQPTPPARAQRMARG
jgi:hypothetical protein